MQKDLAYKVSVLSPVQDNFHYNVKILLLYFQELLSGNPTASSATTNSTTKKQRKPKTSTTTTTTTQPTFPGISAIFNSQVIKLNIALVTNNYSKNQVHWESNSCIVINKKLRYLDLLWINKLIIINKMSLKLYIELKIIILIKIYKKWLWKKFNRG